MSYADQEDLVPSLLREIERLKKHPTCSTCYWCNKNEHECSVCRRLGKPIHHTEVFYCAEHEAKEVGE